MSTDGRLFGFDRGRYSIALRFYGLGETVRCSRCWHALCCWPRSLPRQ